MDKALVAKVVADKLIATEVSLDKAIMDGADLLNGVIAARLELKLSSTVGDAAIAKLSQTLAELSQARTALAEAHRELDITRARVGIRTVMTPYDKDNQGFVTQDRPADRIAALKVG